MIDHTHYRAAVMADPRDPDAELRAHREACPECRAYTEQLLKFDARIERALRVAMPAAAEVLPFTRKSPSFTGVRRWLAIAASVLLAAAIAGGIWLTLPQRSLAAAVVAHMAGEPEAWQRTDIAVDAPALEHALKDSNLRLNPKAGIVSYATSCPFRGHRVPHLVVQTPAGPVTVMVLVHEPLRKTMQFDEQGYRGTLVPVPGHGSLAVLMQDSGTTSAEVARIAAQVDDAIVWTR
jgi:uncharacterized protein DUF3379